MSLEVKFILSYIPFASSSLTSAHTHTEPHIPIRIYMQYVIQAGEIAQRLNTKVHNQNIKNSDPTQHPQ